MWGSVDIVLAVYYVVFLLSFGATTISSRKNPSELTGVVIGVSKDTLNFIESFQPSAMAARAISFYYGFSGLGIPCAIQSYDDHSRLLELSKYHSHILVLNWFDKYMHPLCDRFIGKAIFSFNVTAMYTIEAAYKVQQQVTWTKSVCSHIDILSDNMKFTLALIKFDVVLVGLGEEMQSFRNILASHGTRVAYVPVPVNESFWRGEEFKAKDKLKIFFDWDHRDIGKKDVAEIVLKAVEILRSRKDLPFKNGVQVLSITPVPPEFQSYTKVDSLLPPHSKENFIRHHKFQEIISRCHIYATAIRSSYENPVIESQMGGALLVGRMKTNFKLYFPCI
jgi:hypothetical protein